MESTNRRWQNHIKAKGIVPFFMDRLRSHAMASKLQYNEGPFHFPIQNREEDDALTKAFFEYSEDFPTEIYIETTNRCNLDCQMCARTTMTRPQGAMDFDLFVKIIDEIAIHQPYAYIHWYGVGDPLMDPKIFKRLDYAKSKGLTNSLFFTNGQLLFKKDNWKNVVECGAATLGVDLDGFSQESYGQIRQGGEFQIAKDGIVQMYDYIRKHNKSTRIEIAYQVYPGVNEDEIEPFVEWCVKNDYEYKLVTLHAWAGMRDDLPVSQIETIDDHHGEQRASPCGMLWRLFIGWDGRIGLCFQDANFQNVLGDLNNTSIKEIWDSAHFEKRKKHVQGCFDGLCQSCNSFTNMAAANINSVLYPETLRSK
jgi:sulfatase maturation enzyme AslB (radical SAM superfamily)